MGHVPTTIHVFMNPSDPAQRAQRGEKMGYKSGVHASASALLACPRLHAHLMTYLRLSNRSYRWLPAQNLDLKLILTARQTTNLPHIRPLWIRTQVIEFEVFPTVPTRCPFIQDSAKIPHLLWAIRLCSARGMSLDCKDNWPEMPYLFMNMLNNLFIFMISLRPDYSYS